MTKRPAKKRAGGKPSAKATKPAAEPIEIAPAPKRGRGRPTTYDPAYCERVIELGEQGFSKAQISRELGCSRSSLHLWMKVHPEFAEAMKEAEWRSLAWWEDLGMAGLSLPKFNAQLYAFNMKNRFREHYADKVDLKHDVAEPEQSPDERELTDLDLARRVAFMLNNAVEIKRRREAEGKPVPSWSTHDKDWS